jgi:hypothetical protein
VWGNAVLHHLDVRTAGRELHRVLRPDGIAVFCEPWGENPLLNWARGRWPLWHQRHTPDERPLRRQHLQALRDTFENVEMKGFQLLGMVRRLLRQRHAVAGLQWCDDVLLSRVPILEHYCRYVVLTLRRQ